jgi:hypothetical protein
MTMAASVVIKNDTSVNIATILNNRRVADNNALLT